MNRVSKTVMATLAVVAAGILSSTALAGGGCDRCGLIDGDDCCVLVKDVRIIEVDCYKCECEDFCVALRSQRGCPNDEYPCNGKGDKDGKNGRNGLLGHGQKDCDGKCGKGRDCDRCGREPRFPTKVSWFDWTPGNGARVQTRKVLYRKTVQIEVPSYHWELAKACKDCQGKIKAADVEPGADVPPPPPVEAKLLYGNPHNVQVNFEQPAAAAAPARKPLSNVSQIFSSFLK